MLRRSAILHIIGDVVAPTTAHRRAGALAATATAGAASCSDSSACTARCSPRAGSGILESGTGRDLDRRLLGSHMSTQQGHAGASGRRLNTAVGSPPQAAPAHAPLRPPPRAATPRRAQPRWACPLHAPPPTPSPLSCRIWGLRAPAPAE
jgi:type IV secretory pathway TrbL component